MMIESDGTQEDGTLDQPERGASVQPVPSKPVPSKPAPSEPAPSKPAPSKPVPSKQRANARRRRMRNHVKQLREDQLMSKAEFARTAGLSPLTIDRVENGMPCRMDTKRKIILALGMTVQEKDKVFVPDPPAQPLPDSEEDA